MLEIKPDKLLARGEDGNLHDILALKGDKGDSFKYSDFTEEQLASLHGKSGVQIVTNESQIEDDSNVAVVDDNTEQSYSFVEQSDLTPINASITALYEGIANKLTKPTEGIAVGKYFRVASIDADGNPVIEACDLPVATQSTLGIVKGNNSGGIIVSGGTLYTDPATTGVINSRTNTRMPIVSSNIVHAVNSVLCSTNANEALTDTEKANACQRLGAVRDSYSETEYFTGKYWIDGAKIYARWVNVGALPNNTTKVKTITSDNGFGVCCGIGGIAYNSSYHFPIPLSSPSAPIICYVAKDSSTQLSVCIQTISDRSSLNGYVKVEYTR